MAAADYDLNSFDNIQLCVPDIHSVPRGKVVSGDIKHRLLQKNFDIFNGSPIIGPTELIPISVIYNLGKVRKSNPNHTLHPCLETLTPWPWINTGKRRAGIVLCDMYRPDGSPDLNCPRMQLQRQLGGLRDEHDLVIKTAFEYEFLAYHVNSLAPLGGERNQLMNLRVWGEHQDLLSDLVDVLDEMGVKITAVQAVNAPGQWELNTDPYQGITGADVGFHVKNAVKGFLKTRGYHATFMTKPVLDKNSHSGLHLNHSLWKATSNDSDHSVDNVLVSAEPAEGPLSPTAKHWIAGVLAHAPALSAFLSPTVNCYRRLRNIVTPTHSFWGMEERHAVIRARVQPGNNVFLENRLPSAAASPYLAIAATVAAGRDGLKRRLQCPDPMDVANACELPHSLDQALTALEEDQELSDLMGKDFVSRYVQVKRVGEIDLYKNQTFDSEDQRIAFEREMYFITY